MQTQHAQIAEAAYFLWIEEGRPEGRDADHWTRAQSALDAAPAPAKPARRKAAAPKAAKAEAAPKAKPRRKAAKAA